MNIEKTLKNIQKKLREIALDVETSNHLGENLHNAGRIKKEAEKLDGPIDIYVSGSGTGKD
jgi:hypothetical protein